MANEIFEELKNVLVEELEIAEDAITRDANLFEDLKKYNMMLQNISLSQNVKNYLNKGIMLKNHRFGRQNEAESEASL